MIRQYSIFPDKMKVFSGSMLKVIAMVTMIIDHVGSHLVDRSIILFETETYTLTLYRVMRDIGRLAFPLFCFLLIEGYLHTRSKVRYGVSLGVMALISEIPYDLEHTNKLIDLRAQNIFFTLLLGYLAICAAEHLRKKHPVLTIPVLIGIMLAGYYGKVDYSIGGVAFIVVLYAARKNEFLRIFTSFLIGNPRFVMVAFLPMSLYNGKRGFIKGKFLKYTFYAIYPVHIFIIYLLKLHWGLFQ